MHGLRRKRAAFILSGFAGLAANAFTLHPVVRVRGSSPAALAMSRSDDTNNAPMSYQEALRRSRAAKAGGAPPAPRAAAPAAEQPAVAAPKRSPPPMDEAPFSDDMYDTIREAITLLTARLNRRQPVSPEELQSFKAAVARILDDASTDPETAAAFASAAPAASARPGPAQAQAKTPPSASAAGDAAADIQTRAAAPEKPQSRVAKGAAQMQSDDPNLQGQDDEDFDLETEGETEFDGQYGRAKGTANTYFVEGMAGMGAEEYQEALRAKLINRAQTKRKTGSYGNIAANSYLHFLNTKPTFDDITPDLEVDDEDFQTY